jgi:hypothetical protein
MNRQNPNELVLSVQIPRGKRPGEKLTVSAPDGRLFEIIIPNGTREGDVINVVVDGNVTGNSTTVANETQTRSIVTPTDPKSGRAALAAAAAAAVTGAVLVGPITGVCVAGAALYATTRDDEIGDATRKAGAAACLAYDKAKEAGVFDKLAEAGRKTLQKAHELNDEYKITDRISETARQIENEHHVSDRLAAGAAAVVAKTPGAIGAMMKLVANASSSRDSK